MHGRQIKFELDNMTAVSYVYQMGGRHSVIYDRLAGKIWNWCITRNIWLTAIHIPGIHNVQADALSRKGHSDHEWMLNKQLFDKLNKTYKFTIDLFASSLNAQFTRYVAWLPDPNSSYVDAFSRSWENEFFYAFPPFRLIPKCAWTR